MSTKTKQKKNLHAILSVVVLILIASGIMYFTRSYPVAMVGSSFIPTYELETSILIAKRMDPNPDKEKIFNQLVENKKKQQMVGKMNVDDELKFYVTGKNEEYKKFLADYFSGNEKLFVQYVVAPLAYDAALRMKYNSDFTVNNDAYNKASNLINKLNEAQSFEELAKTYSDDKISGQFAGDLGFVMGGQLIPELEKAVISSTVGEVKKQIVVSRLGYHIIYPVEVAEKGGQKAWHVKHILVQTTGYEDWMSKKLNSIKVRRFY